MTIPHNRLSHGDAEVEAISRVVRGGHWAMGHEVRQLETELSDRTGWSGGACVGSGSAALRLCLRASGVGPGDEVIIPAYSCVALANSILACGAVPVAADILPVDWTIDPVDVGRLVTERTKAVVAVNNFGVPADLAALGGFGCFLIEDLAHGFVDVDQIRKPDAAITSFYATKMIAGGEGGAVLCDHAEILANIRDWRDYTDREAGNFRMNDKMTDLSASLARCQLARIDDFVERRRQLAAAYDAVFAPLANQGLSLPSHCAGRIWYRYAITTRFEAQTLIDALARRGVAAAQPVRDWRPRGTRSSPVSDEAYRRVVSLPLYPTLSEHEQAIVIGAVQDAMAELWQ
jgi:perosamine synthetase